MAKLQAINFVQKKVKLDQIVGEETKQIVISDTLEVPCEKPPIEQIITVIVENVSAEYDILRGRVLVDGNICFKVLYVADMSKHHKTYQQPVFAFEDAIPFSEVVEIDCVKADDDIDATVKATVEDIKTSLVGVDNEPCEKEDREGTRRVRVRMVVELEVTVTRNKEVKIITDLK